MKKIKVKIVKREYKRLRDLEKGAFFFFFGQPSTPRVKAERVDGKTGAHICYGYLTLHSAKWDDEGTHESERSVVELDALVTVECVEREEALSL